MLVIDGARGEGGGQILRAALSLAVHTGQAFRLIHIRARRPKPGLRPQHLTAVRAAASLCDAHVEGDRVGSQELTFTPTRRAQAGSYRFDVGTAGATTLILETLLPPLAELDAASWLALTGGTHVPWSPPYHYLERVFLPPVRNLGWNVVTELKRWGWYPRGGGRIQATIRPPHPAPALVDWTERGELQHLWLLSASSNLPAHIRQRQAKRAQQRLREAGLSPDEVHIVDAPSPGVGTCVIIAAEYENGWGGSVSLGKKGKPAEHVAEEAVADFLTFHRSGASLDVHLADQVIVPLLVRGSAWKFTTPRASNHLRTVIWLARHFVPKPIEIQEKEGRIIVQCLNSCS